MGGRASSEGSHDDGAHHARKATGAHEVVYDDMGPYRSSWLAHYAICERDTVILLRDGYQNVYAAVKCCDADFGFYVCYLACDESCDADCKSRLSHLESDLVSLGH